MLRICIGFNANSDPYPALEVISGSTSDSCTQGFNDQKMKNFTAGKIQIFSNLANYLSLGLQEHPALLHFYYFVGNFCPTGYGSNRPISFNQSMHHPDPTRVC
jgi:hypothetical protein